MDNSEMHKKNQPDVYKDNIFIKSQKKYEDRININASNLIQGVWESIYEENKVS